MKISSIKTSVKEPKKSSDRLNKLKPAREPMESRCVGMEEMGCKDSAGGSAGLD